ncbi:SCO family protein [Pontibacter sp. 13R65]|uniref:SCO family protein n=1 Tax=Pontibacter sp. 13R65 TaxID=3127458 RepID=UPI00301C71FD
MSTKTSYLSSMVTRTDVKAWAAGITRNISEDEIAELIDAIKACPGHKGALVDLLPEQAPLYAGRSANEVMRIRGYILAAFERVGLHDLAIPFVLEELESGRDAYLVAGAAKAIRGLRSPTAQVVPYLFKAIQNIKYVDDALTFDSYKPQWPLKHYTTALQEIFLTFAWLGAYARQAVDQLETLHKDEFADFSSSTRREIRKAIEQIQADSRTVSLDCCKLPLENVMVPDRALQNSNYSKMKQVELQDQDGSYLTYNQFFCDKPTILAFFYTRCSNPNKCSATITKLAHLQKSLQNQGLVSQIKIAAITYDPAFDLPPRLKGYGENRGFSFGEENCLFRVTSGFEDLQGFLALGVNFIGSLVNKHRIELFVLDKDGKVAYAFTRLQWDVEEVVEQAKQLVLQEKADRKAEDKQVFRGKAVLSSFQAVVVPMLVALFPKCPYCWAAYMSVFGVAGIQAIPYKPELLFVLILVMLANLWWMYKLALKRNGLLPFYLCCIGALCVVGGFYADFRMMLFMGLALSVAGTMLNNLPFATYAKIQYVFGSKYRRILKSRSI